MGLPGLANYKHLAGLLGGQNGLTVAPPVPPAALGETFPLERWQAWIACVGLAGGLLAVVATLAAPGAFPLTLSLQLIAAIIIGGRAACRAPCGAR